MTLITNFIGKDFIILASDRRQISFDNSYHDDDTQKLFASNNYCVGVQGDLCKYRKDDEKKKVDLIEEIKKHINRNPVLSKYKIKCSFYRFALQCFEKFKQNNLLPGLNYCIITKNNIDKQINI